MSMAGFNRKYGNPGGKHRWINYLNKSVRKCAICGLISRCSNGSTVYEKDSRTYDACPECKPISKDLV